jgi:cyclopropane fatty-acyl-phospholipid synthase-like methyltransferase
MSAYGPLGTLFRDAQAPAADSAEVEWYATRLPRDTGPILELMAGSGRLLVPLLERGLHVHGVDASEARLASCRARLRDRGRETELFRQNVAALNLPFRYGGAFAAGGSFQLLTGRAPLDALLRARAHLVDPGLLLLHLFVPAAASHPPGAAIVEVRTVSPGEGLPIGLRSETMFDVESRRIDITNRYERRDKTSIVAREDERLSMTWYTEDEAVALLRDAGYREIEIVPAPRARDEDRSFAAIGRA